MLTKSVVISKGLVDHRFEKELRSQNNKLIRCEKLHTNRMGEEWLKDTTP